MRQVQDIKVPNINKTLLGLFLLVFGFSFSLNASSNALSGEISGSVFVDENINGVNDDSYASQFENLTEVSSVIVYLYDEQGKLLNRTLTDALGQYKFTQLNPNDTYRVEFKHNKHVVSSLETTKDIYQQVSSGNNVEVNYAVVLNSSSDDQQIGSTYSKTSNKLNQFNQLHINTSFSYDAFINYATFGAANGQSTYSSNTSVHMPATNNWNNEGRVPFQVTDDYAAEANPNSSAATVFESALTEQSVNARTALEQSESNAGVAFVVLESGVSEACYCLANATLDEAGQFVNVLSITTDVPGETWQIISASGIEQGITTPDEEFDLSTYVIGDQVATVPFATGINAEALYEDAQDSSSIYSFAGVSADGDVFEVEVTNGSDTVAITGGGCNYNEQIILGQENVCESSVTSYCVEENPGSTYSWSLSGGGVIMTAADAACIEVLWDPGVGGPYTLSVEQTNASLCLNPSAIDVEVGVPGGALACIAKANISLSPDCNLVVTPDLVLESPITGDQVYTVIVTDPEGNELLEPIITAEYVGQEMEVTIMDVCSGNSCWTQITVFDKIKPTVDAQDVTISCNEDPNLPFPLGLDNCDTNPIVELVSESIEQLSCNTNFTTEITRVFVATDSEGNKSVPTEQRIFLERIDLDSIVFPIDRTVIDGNPVFCQQFDIDENGNPAPSTAGVPTYKGLSLYPYQDQFCSFGISYTDLVVAPNSCFTKVMRTWTAHEWWCGQSIIETVIQEINIADIADPAFEVPADITVTTNVAECVATVELPAISPEDDCSDTFEVDIQYPGGFLNNSNGGSVDVELGTSTITYTVYDACLNSASQSFTITVEDNTEPVMVCDQNSVIALNVDGVAYAPASVFDDGTIEDCTDLTFEVLRMDNGSACGAFNTEFGPFVEFCCADVGETVQVLLKATDENNNTNTCMVNVVVQDKNPPVLTVPADMTIECTDPYDPDNLGLTFGTASATDNCLNTTISEEANIAINDCNTGFIVRTFTASDGNGEAVGTQTITVQNSNVFALSDITWPLDYTTDESCDVDGLQPEDLEAPYNSPVLTPNACDMIDLGFQDQSFTTSDDACFKIIRTWMVMDMCNIQSDGSPMMFMHDQTIVVTNSVDPVITSLCDSISSSLNADCDEGFISLTASATDDCTATENIRNSYFIDINNDGSFDQTETSVGGTILVEGFYPLGTHRIVYEFEDLCGNEAVCTQMFTIFNSTPPLANLQDLAVELTPIDTDGDNILDSEMAFLDVELVGGDSETPCGSPFTLSYDTEGDSTVAVFDCFNLGINIVTVYVTDSISGLQSSGTATVIIQDNNDVDICPKPEDCIVWPDTNLLVDFCVVDLQPESIFSEAEVTEPCVCGDFDVTFTDVDISSDGDACADIERTWLVTFNCFLPPLEYTFVQTIKQLNAFEPIIISCPDTVFSMSMDGTCFAPVTVDLPTFDSSCSFGVVTTNDSQFSNSSVGAATGSYPVGITDVTYTLTDECGNASTCDVVVVVNDTGAPLCQTMDATIILDANGNYTLDPSEVDGGSSDICGDQISLAVSPNTFTCDSLGDVTVTLTVTDLAGNSSECTATVTVTDTIAPICNAGTANITLFSNTDVTVPASFVDAGSTDACGTIVSTTITPNVFGCGDIGMNTVILTVTDDSGNSSTCEGFVNVTDQVAPICQVQDITVMIEISGLAIVDALDVDNGSFDDCGMIVSYTIDSDTFDCDDVGVNSVVLTVTDNSGNTCTSAALVTVLDPDNFCDNAPQGLVVEGDVKTIQGEIVEGTTVSLEGMVNLTTTVASNGLYAFPSVPLFSNATILPYNNSNLLHGITTLDVLMIQNHIMNVNILTSPYDLIAADVDHSESISGNDIISLQKLILGETDVFDNNTSFRFVDSNYEFLDVTDPFMTNFPETADFTNLSEGMSQDFIGIKVGDVNGSFVNQPGSDGPTQIDIHTRSTHSLSLESTEIRSSGGFVEVPVYSENFEALQAMEMSIVSEKRIVDVLPGSIDLNKSEFRTSQFGRKLKISWVNPSVIDVKSGDLLFTLVVKSDENLVPADVITLSPSVNEFYTDKYEIAELRFSNETNVLQQAKAVLYQNAPNPWSNETMISFEMVQDGDYMLSFFDMDGKLLTQLTGYASKGYNEVQVYKSEIGMQSGVIVYEFTSGNRKLVKCMVMME